MLVSLSLVYSGALQVLGETFERRDNFCAAAKTYEQWALVSKRADDNKPGECYVRAALKAQVASGVVFHGHRTQNALRLLGEYREKRKKFVGAADAFLRWGIISTEDDFLKAGHSYMRVVRSARNSFWSIRGHGLQHPEIRRTVRAVFLVAQRLAYTTTHPTTSTTMETTVTTATTVIAPTVILLPEMWLEILMFIRAIDYLSF